MVKRIMRASRAQFFSHFGWISINHFLYIPCFSSISRIDNSLIITSSYPVTLLQIQEPFCYYTRFNLINLLFIQTFCRVHLVQPADFVFDGLGAYYICENNIRIWNLIFVKLLNVLNFQKLNYNVYTNKT